MKKIIIFIITLYRKFISPLKPPCCRFYPTCSRYALDAVTRHGVVKGGFLALKRILKCNPLFAGGVDRVPENFSPIKSCGGLHNKWIS